MVLMEKNQKLNEKIASKDRDLEILSEELYKEKE